MPTYLPREKVLKYCKGCNKTALFVTKADGYFTPVCASCMVEYHKERNIKRVENNCCLNCGKSNNNGKRTCDYCLVNAGAGSKAYHKAVKQKAVEYLGSYCTGCLLKTDKYYLFDFHHIDPRQKLFNIAYAITNKYSWDDIAKELDKCELLCVMCHRTYPQRKDMRVSYVQDRNKKAELKQKSVDYSGGCCLDCGLISDDNRIFDFHHRDKSTKIHDICTLINNRSSWDEIKEELDKCDLLCCYCHRARHNEPY